MSMYDEVQQAIRKAIDERCDLAVISVDWCANAAYQQFSAGDEEPHVRYGCIEHLKQVARKIMGAKFNPDGEENEAHQDDMFSGTLQERYPIPRKNGEEPVYKLRYALTDTELDWNVSALMKSADARIAHANALLAYRDLRAREQKSKRKNAA